MTSSLGLGGEVGIQDHTIAEHLLELGLKLRVLAMAVEGLGRRKGRVTDGATRTVPFVGRIPLYQAIREGGDSGVPLVISEPDSPAARAFLAAAERAAAQVSIASFTRQTIPLTVVR